MRVILRGGRHLSFLYSEFIERRKGVWGEPLSRKATEQEKRGRPFERPEYAYYVAEALTAASPAMVASVYVIFLLSRGLNFKQVAIVDGFYMAVSAIVDFPTGGMADKYGRGLMAGLGNLFMALGLLSYGMSRSFPQFLLSEGLAAVGFAFYSGALEAWLVDSLKGCKREGDVSKVFGTTGLLSFIVSSISSFIGGAIAEFGQEKAFLAGSATSFAGSLFVFLVIGRARIDAPERKERAYLSYLKRGLKITFENIVIKGLLVVLAFIALAIPSFTLTWAPRLKELGASMWLLGATSSILFASAGLAQYLGGRLVRRFGLKKVAFVGTLFISLSFTLMALSPSLAIFIASALLFEVGYGLRLPPIRTWFNRAVPSEERATVLSLRSTLLRPLSIIGMMIMGALSDWRGICVTYLWGLLISLPACFILLFIPELSKTVNEAQN